MAINFNALPDEKPNALPAAGEYLGVIESAEMKQPNDQSKPMYLNLKINLFNEAGKKVGTIYDIISESTNEVVQYKIKRFITALKIPVVGMIELRDICKICVGKKFYVDVKIDKNEQYGDRAVVDVFKNDIYRPYEADEDIPFMDAPINAPDGVSDNSAPEEY